MKVAFLHLEFSGGPVEDNLKKICLAIIKAAESGAKCVVTPEIALQGYFFSEKADKLETVLVPNLSIDSIKKLAKKYQITIFLCCAEIDEDNGHYYNSCQVISPEGEIISKQHKMSGHTIGAEAWSKKGDKFLPVQIGELKIGILICCDSWYVKNAETARYLDVDLILVPAAWNDYDCGGGMPEDAWKRCSELSRAPVWVCNQTGNSERLDLNTAKSAVLVDGMTRLVYSGKPALLFFDWDKGRNNLISKKFEKIFV